MTQQRRRTDDRITIGLITKTRTDLDYLAAHTGMSSTDVCNRAVQLYAFTERMAAEGNELLLRSPDGQLAKVHML